MLEDYSRQVLKMESRVFIGTVVLSGIQTRNRSKRSQQAFDGCYIAFSFRNVHVYLSTHLLPTSIGCFRSSKGWFTTFIVLVIYYK